MCLAVVKRLLSGKSTKLQVGYKVFKPLYAGYGAPVFGGQYIRKHWYTASDGNIKYGPAFWKPRNTYPSGFHIYKNRKDAVARAPFWGKETTVLKVYYTNTVVQGIQNDLQVIVAKRMRIA